MDEADEKGKSHCAWLNHIQSVSAHITLCPPGTDVPEDRVSVDKPVLMLLCLRCPITLADFYEQSTRPYVRDLQVKRMDTGHWPQLEAKEETNRYLSEFFDGVLEKSSL